MTTTQKRELSQQAQAAKMIREYCKSIGVKCTARSDSFSMGDSVDWEVRNVDPETYQQIKDYADQFQYGHFDGMDDSYNLSNTRSDLPQTKYCHGSNSFDPELYQRAWELFKASASNGDGMPTEYEKAKDLQWCDQGFNYDDKISQYVRKILNGSDLRFGGFCADISRAFWDERKQAKPAAVAAPVASGTAAHVEKHTHTKRSFDFWIVVLADRVTRDQFDALLDQCKSAGGWYSRKWGTTPAGFAFRDQSAAGAMAASINEQTPDQPLTGETVKAAPASVKSADEVTAARLRKLAENMQSLIDNKFSERLTNTQKRLAQAMHARADGERLKRTQAGLIALAELYAAGTVPAELQHVKSKADAFALAAARLEPIANGFHSYHVDTGQPATDTPESRAFWALLTGKSEAEKQADQLRQKIIDLQFVKIPGYFPTPDPVIQEMIARADISADHTVLDPSAGHGAICDAVAGLCAEVKAFEINYQLAEILDQKDYLIEKPRDFLTVDPVEITSYDRILMNPPFERLQDIDHVMHAIKFLKPGGRLVAIMSNSGFFRSDKKAENFRGWFEMLGGEAFDIPAGAFKESGTQIATKMIVIDKPDQL